MTGPVYVDTSALLKTLRREAETEALLADLLGRSALTSSEVTITELHRAAAWWGVARDAVDRRLQQLDLVPLSRSQLTAAGLLADPAEPPDTRLRSLDAIHVSAALQVESPSVLTYDRNRSRAARGHGLTVLHPGRAADRFV